MFDNRRQINIKSRAFAGFGMDMQAAVSVFEEAVNDGQSQTGALAGSFRGEVGLENFWQHVRGNARAVVPHRQAQ